jgi:serine/threonine-protein kinase
MLQGYCELWAGRGDAARATFERIVHATAQSPTLLAGPGREIRSYLALAYAGLGEKEKALEHGRQAVADYKSDAVIGALAERYLAEIEAHVGEVDAAIARVARLLEVPRGIQPADLRLSPFWDPLRQDPRFQALVEHPSAVRY